MLKRPFLERLQEKPLLADGAMGTMLHYSGINLGVCFDELNMTDPALVARVHQQYIDAGAELIETNTFSANDYKLAQYGLQHLTIDINEAGVELAKQIIEKSGREVYLAGSVGPLGVWIEPIGRISEAKAYEAFRKQIATLVFSGVDVLVLETFSDLNEIAIAAKAARDVKKDIPIIANLTFNQDDRTLLGDNAVAAAEALRDAGADVIGVNCSIGPAQLMRIASIMKQVVPDKHLAVLPNAGYPEHHHGRVVYPASPDYFGEYALAFADLGVSIMGGCCGTTPDHIRAMREALDDESRPHATLVEVPRPSDIPVQTPDEQPTELAQKLQAGQFVTTVEMSPPRSFNPQKVIASAEMLRDAGLDFINVSDAPLARMRMSPWAVSYLIKERVGIETILHFPTRGRNLLRVQGDLLATHALNVRNIFVVMGDPTKIGDYPEAFDTHDVVPTGLISLIKQRFNQGEDQAGNSIGQPTNFYVSAALNMNPKEMEAELKLTHKKIENGADFFLSQPVFDIRKIETFLRAYEDFYGEPIPRPILAGLLPLYSPRHASFLHNEVPGLEIPDALMERMQKAENAEAEGIRIGRELIHEFKNLVQGAYLMPPFGRYYLAAEVVEAIVPQRSVKV